MRYVTVMLLLRKEVIEASEIVDACSVAAECSNFGVGDWRAIRKDLPANGDMQDATAAAVRPQWTDEPQ